MGAGSRTLRMEVISARLGLAEGSYFLHPLVEGKSPPIGRLMDGCAGESGS